MEARGDRHRVYYVRARGYIHPPRRVFLFISSIKLAAGAIIVTPRPRCGGATVTTEIPPKNKIKQPLLQHNITQSVECTKCVCVDFTRVHGWIPRDYYTSMLDGPPRSPSAQVHHDLRGRQIISGVTRVSSDDAAAENRVTGKFLAEGLTREFPTTRQHGFVPFFSRTRNRSAAS